MQRLIYSIFISFFLFISCGKIAPSDILSEKKMAEVLTEVSILDGYLNNLPADSAKKVLPVLYDKIFKKYDIDSAQFVKNINYYYGNPELTERVYKKVDNNLHKYERAAIEEDSVRNAFVQDSINRINHFRRMYSNLENLRYYHGMDTLKYDYVTYTQRFYSADGLEFVVSALRLNPIRVPNFTQGNIKGKGAEISNTHKDINIYTYPYVAVDTVKKDTSLWRPRHSEVQKDFENFNRIYFKGMDKSKPNRNEKVPPGPSRIILDRTAAPVKQEKAVELDEEVPSEENVPTKQVRKPKRELLPKVH